MLISTIQQLVTYCGRLRMDSGGVDGIDLTVPGCTENEISRLTQIFPQLPQSYIGFITSYDTSRFELLFCSVYPSLPRGSFVDRLIALNSNELNPAWSFLTSHKLFEVGSWDSSRLCVLADPSSPDTGAVSIVEYSEGIFQGKPLARSISDFVVLLGDLDANIVKAGDVDQVDAEAWISDVQVHFMLSEPMAVTWFNVVQML